MTVRKRIVKKIKSVLIDRCLREGIDTPEDIDIVVIQALKTINASSLAGHKAAKTKKQTLAYQRN